MTDFLIASNSFPSSLAFCYRLTRRSRSSFRFAFRLLPQHKREGMNALYAYMRATDDIADAPGEPDRKHQQLHCWRLRLELALRGQYSHRVHAALHATVQRFGIPCEYLYQVIQGVECDIEPQPFRTFEELQQYCYRVASVVGLACVRIWGLRSPDAEAAHREPAIAAGIAFQLTNILRDLAEDHTQERCYLPAEECVQFGISPNSWNAPQHREALQKFLTFQIARARQFYAQSVPLNELLSSDGQRVFRLMSQSYESLLNRIEAAGPDVLLRRVRVSKWVKLRLLAASVW